MRKARSAATTIGLLIALGSPFIFSFYLAAVREQLADPWKVILALLGEWIPTLLVLGVVLFWEREPLASIGLRPMTKRDVLWGLGAWLVGNLTFFISMPIVSALGLDTTVEFMSHVARIPLILRVAIMLTGGIAEEILYRGYAFERLATLTARPGLAALITYFFFVVMHLPFVGLGGTLQIGLWSLVLTLLYLRRRSLPACMLMHALNDLQAHVLFPIYYF